MSIQMKQICQTIQSAVGSGDLLLLLRQKTPSARLAQSVEHETLNLRVVGSSPTLGETFCALASLFFGGKKNVRFYRDLNSDRRIQSPEC